MPRLNVITIATGDYLQFFRHNFHSLQERLRFDGSISFTVLTDRPSDLGDLRSRGVEAVYLPQAPWPQITLFRYRYILPVLEETDATHILWLDADMELATEFDISFITKDDRVWVAPHPGFGLRAARTVSSAYSNWNQRLLFSAFEGQAALGTWERRKRSNAFVPRFQRSVYVHGAVWGGASESVLAMARELASRTDEDFQNGLVARWHDESHLNWFASFRSVAFFDVGFSSWAEGPTFKSETAVFLSQDKKQLRAQLS